MPGRKVFRTTLGLTTERALPRRARAAFARERAYCWIRDLNDVYFNLSSAAMNGRPPERPAQIGARVNRLLAGAVWIADELVAQAWAFLRDEVEDVEDAFGPAVLLGHFAGDEPAVRQLLANLSGELRNALALLDLGAKAQAQRP